MYRLSPSTSDGSSVQSSSDYMESRYNATAAFDAYKRPTMIQKPKGDYDVKPNAPTVMSASQYLRQKYGDFSSAVEVSPPQKPPSQIQILGKDALTVGDLKLLQNTIDAELLRLANIRSDALSIQMRKSQLEFLADNLGTVLGAVERGEVKVEEVAIFPATARIFLKTFRTSETVPELFDASGKSPASMGFAAAAAPKVASATAPVTTAKYAKSSEVLPWFFENIQKLKWTVEADYFVEQHKQREMRNELRAMEERILSYSYTDTPMPEGYQKLFLEKIRSIEKELNNVPE